MRQCKPSMQIISINQQVEAFSDYIPSFIEDGEYKDSKNRHDMHRYGVIMAWSAKMITRLAHHIQNHGDTWDNADEDLILKCEERPPWAR